MNSDEAKKLIAVEGYAVVDIRDKTQFKRAHIKNCYHAPLFIENNDSDLGLLLLLFKLIHILVAATTLQLVLYQYHYQEQ